MPSDIYFKTNKEKALVKTNKTKANAIRKGYATCYNLAENSYGYGIPVP